MINDQQQLKDDVATVANKLDKIDKAWYQYLDMKKFDMDKYYACLMGQFMKSSPLYIGVIDHSRKMEEDVLCISTRGAEADIVEQQWRKQIQKRKGQLN